MNWPATGLKEEDPIVTEGLTDSAPSRYASPCSHDRPLDWGGTSAALFGFVGWQNGHRPL
jgi:hypothetical protein